jgi:hypothetical protein
VTSQSSLASFRVKEILKLLKQRRTTDGFSGREIELARVSALLDNIIQTGDVERMQCIMMLWAPFLSEPEAQAVIAERIALRRTWDAKELGQLFRVSVAERSFLRVKTIRPTDENGIPFDDDAMAVLRRAGKARSSAKSRKAKAAKAEQQGQAAADNADMTDRELLIFDKVGVAWSSTTTIAERLKRSHKFTAGERKDIRSVRRAVTRFALKFAGRWIEIDKQRLGSNGQPLWFLRRIDRDFPTVHAKSVTATLRQAETPAKS